MAVKTRASVLAVLSAGVIAALAGCAPQATPLEPPVGAPAPVESPAAEPADVDDDSLVVAFYGDSYTRGAGASDASLRWSTLVSQEWGWHEFNPSVSGLGFYNSRFTTTDPDLPGAIIARQPDAVIITMGLNDSFSYARAGDAIAAQIELDLVRLDEALPGSDIIVVEPFWYTDERPESVEVIIEWVRDSAALIDAPFIDGASRWLEGRPDLMADDGIHPNDAGHAEIAKRMTEELRALALRTPDLQVSARQPANVF